MTTSITALNIHIATDASEVYEAAKKMSSTMRTVSIIVEASKTPIEKYQDQLTKLDAAYIRNKITTEQYVRGVQQIGKAYDELSRKQTEAANKDTSTTGSMLANVKRLAAAYLGMQTARSIVSIAADAEAAAAQFEVLTGSASETQKLLADMRKFAAASPLSLTSVMDAGKTLLTFGLNADEAMKRLKQLGEMTGGNAEKMKLLTLAYAQSAAAGRLLGQDANQMAQHGFNPLKLMVEKTGIAYEVFKKQMEDGKFTIEMVNEAIDFATTGTGRFAGMTDKLSKTFSGSYQQMVGAAQDLAIAIGENVLPAFTSLLNEITKGIRWITETVNGFTALDRIVIASGAAFIAAAGTVLMVAKALTAMKVATMAAGVAQAFLIGLSGPAGWAIVIGAVAAATAAYIGLRNATQETIPVQEASKASIVAQTGAFKGLADSVNMAVAAAKERDAAALVAAKMEDAAIKRAATLNAQHMEDVHALMMQRAELTMSAEAYARLQDAAKGYSQEQQDVLAGLRAEIKALEDKKKAEEESKKKQEELAKMLADAAKKAADFAREQIKQAQERKKQQEEEILRTQQQAIEAARRHFEEQRRRQMEMRSAVAKGPSGFEAGSAEAARFLAEQSNALMAAVAVPDAPTPGEKEIADEAARQLKIQEDEQKKRALILLELQKLNVNVVDNKVQRIRP